MTDIELHLTAVQPLSALALLQSHCDLPIQRLQQLMRQGAVWHTQGQRTQRLRKPDQMLAAGEQLHLYYDKKTTEFRPPPALLLADEGDYSVWFKPAGMLSQGNKWGDHHSMPRWVEAYFAEQKIAKAACKVVHRLDRQTTGLMLIAHTQVAASGLARCFREREIRKTYQAIVSGGVRDDWYRLGGKQTVEKPLDGKPARSHLQVLALAGAYALIEVNIETGRMHQVRRHLAAVGLPIVGDERWGNGEPTAMQLCAVALRFDCPVSGLPRHYQVPATWRPQLASLQSC